MGLLGSDRPRPHHYQFAHRVMPGTARQVAVRLPELAADGRLNDALRATWEQIGLALDEGDRLSPDGLSGQMVEVDGHQVALITLPRALHVTEAHFAAVVLGTDPVRYVVLEHSWTLADQPDTVLGEWTPDVHINLGSGPPPTQREFLKAVGSLLA